MSTYDRFKEADQKEKMTMFHWRDSLYFGRLPDGTVRIVKFSAPPHVLKRHAEGRTQFVDYVSADGEFHDVKILLDVRIPPGEWASIIACTSKRGEHDGGYAAAMKFLGQWE